MNWRAVHVLVFSLFPSFAFYLVFYTRSSLYIYKVQVANRLSLHSRDVTWCDSDARVRQSDELVLIGVSGRRARSGLT